MMRTWTSSRIKNAEVIDGLVLQHDGGAVLYLQDGEDVDVDREYMMKHQPQQDGYYIEYADDGYRSYCPADVFERNHTET